MKDVEMKIRGKIRDLDHRVDMMRKRIDQIIHEAMTARTGRNKEMLEEMNILEIKIKEDEKFIKFLKDLLKDLE